MLTCWTLPFNVGLEIGQFHQTKIYKTTLEGRKTGTGAVWPKLGVHPWLWLRLLSSPVCSVVFFWVWSCRTFTHLKKLLTIIPRVHVGYESAIIISRPTIASGIIVLLKTPTKYREFFPTLFVRTTNFELVFNFEQMRTVTIFGEHGIMAHIPWWLSQSEL